MNQQIFMVEAFITPRCLCCVYSMCVCVCLACICVRSSPTRRLKVCCLFFSCARVYLSVTSSDACVHDETLLFKQTHTQRAHINFRQTNRA